MACELCEHCQSPVSVEDRITIREGFSYHKKCHKCYVCSETNLLNAEVFKGVIFCNSCAQRIFQGCSTARRTKTMFTGRGKRRKSKSHRRDRDRARYQDRKRDNSRDGVIELARLTGSNSESEEHIETKQRKPTKLTASDHALQGEKNTHVETVDPIKRNSSEMGTTTDVTQQLLKCYLAEYERVKPRTPPPQRKRQHSCKKKEKCEPIKTKPTCSDLRIAELGMSTEIANMALRKASEVPVNIHSDTRLKGNTSYTFTVVKMKSDKFDEAADWVDSAYSTIEESEPSRNMNMMDRRLGSILQMPLKLFKKHILDRSSLVSVLMSDDKSTDIFSGIRRILNQEVVEHQVRGLRRLYSTINRNSTPCRLGWVSLSPKGRRDSNICSCSYGKRCKHYRDSHSYRCMRAQVMKIAGPTRSDSLLIKSYRTQLRRNLDSLKQPLPEDMNCPLAKAVLVGILQKQSKECHSATILTEHSYKY